MHALLRIVELKYLLHAKNILISLLQFVKLNYFIHFNYYTVGYNSYKASNQLNLM